MSKATAVVSGVIFTCLLVLPAASQQPTNPCNQSEQRQFDFWVGEWKLTWPGPKGEAQHGTNSIHRVLDGCVVEENFSGGDVMHLRGKSLSTYDARLGKWKQTWVDNEGGYLDFFGEFSHGQMILSRKATGRNGKKFLQRMVFKNIRPNQLDWSWERSEDGGKSWTVVWPIHYEREQ
jgi:hypothetical protein